MSKYGVFSGPYFPAFGLNTEKYGPENTPYLDNFHAVKIIFYASLSFHSAKLKDGIPTVKIMIAQEDVERNYQWLSMGLVAAIGNAKPVFLPI